MPAHDHELQNLHYSLKKEIDELYWSLAIKNFGISLTSIFGVIYVYLLFEKSIPATFIYYLLQYGSFALFVPLGARLIRRVGIKKLMAIANVFFAVYLILLLLAPSSGFWVIGLALLFKILYLIFFWPAKHIDFARFVQQDKRGRQIGVANIITALVKTAAPLLGGFIIVWFGFTPLFILAAVLISAAAVPLFRSPEVFEEYSLGWWQSYTWLFKKKNIRTTFAFFFEGMEYLTSIFLFAIFIFIMIGEFQTIGWVTSLSLVTVIILSYLIGWLSDKKGSGQVISFASVAHAFSWLINFFIRTPVQFLIYSTFFRLAEAANKLPFTSTYYQNAKHRGHGIDEYIIFHEIAHNIGRVVMALIIVIGFTLGLTSFFYYFAMAAIAALLFRLIK